MYKQIAKTVLLLCSSSCLFGGGIGNATVYPIHNTECPLLIKCHSINVTLLYIHPDCGKIEEEKNGISNSVLSSTVIVLEYKSVRHLRQSSNTHVAWGFFPGTYSAIIFKGKSMILANYVIAVIPLITPPLPHPSNSSQENCNCFSNTNYWNKDSKL